MTGYDLGDYLVGWMFGAAAVVAVTSIALWEVGWYLWRHVGFTWS